MFYNPKAWHEYAERHKDKNILNFSEKSDLSFTYKNDTKKIYGEFRFWVGDGPNGKYVKRIQYYPNIFLIFAMYQLISDENSSFHMEDLELLYVMPKELKPYYVCFLTYKYGLAKSSEFYYYLPKLE